jgi:peroxiredoxin
MKRKILFLCLLALIVGSKSFAQSLGMGVKLGEKCPEISFGLYDGSDKKLSEYLGNTILIHFWGIRCDTCLKMVSELNKLQKEYGRFVVVSVNDGKSDDFTLRKFVTENKIRYAIAFDRADFLYRKLSNASDYGLPFNLLLDKKGTVVKINPNLKEVEEYLGSDNILKYFKKKKKPQEEE